MLCIHTTYKIDIGNVLTFLANFNQIYPGASTIQFNGKNYLEINLEEELLTEVHQISIRYINIYTC